MNAQKTTVVQDGPKASPASIEEIQAEVQWIQQLIERTTERINSSECDSRQFLHLEICRAEQQAYLAGLLYALGHPTILDRLDVLCELKLDAPRS